jgi:hypothetical protein
MFIGILATLILIGIGIGQYLESKKSGLLRLARDTFEDRDVRYEGVVTYQRGTFDGVVCLISPEKRLFALEGAQAAAEGTGQLTLRGAGTEIAITTNPARAQMIQRTLQ